MERPEFQEAMRGAGVSRDDMQPKATRSPEHSNELAVRAGGRDRAAQRGPRSRPHQVPLHDTDEPRTRRAVGKSLRIHFCHGFDYFRDSMTRLEDAVTET